MELRTVGPIQARRTIDTTIGIVDSLLAHGDRVTHTDMVRLGRNVLGTPAIVVGKSDDNAPLNDALDAVTRLVPGDPDRYLGLYIGAAGAFLMIRKQMAANPTARSYALEADTVRTLQQVRAGLSYALDELASAGG